METWGVDSFENDDAKSWVAAYRDMGLFVAKSTMEVALGDFEASGGVSADVARRAIVAAEAVGFAIGRGSPAAQTAFADAPVADVGEAKALVPMVEDVLNAVLSGSELAMIWGETAENDAWCASVKALKARVAGAAEAAEASAPAAAVPAAPAAAPLDDMNDADLRALVLQLSSELQIMRKEMHDGMNGLARMIKRRSG